MIQPTIIQGDCRQTWTHCYDKPLKGFITDESFSHPAKFSLALIERIFDHCLAKGWLKPGDTVGDPFLRRSLRSDPGLPLQG